LRLTALVLACFVSGCWSAMTIDSLPPDGVEPTALRARRGTRSSFVRTKSEARQKPT
jgi:hypothetical protein